MQGEHRTRGTTRSEILQLLRRKGHMTAAELSGELGVGAVGVRQHLVMLCNEGLVVAVGVRRGLGRPSHLYSLTSKAEQLFPKTYERIALDALAYIASCGSGQIEQMFEARRRRLAVQFCQDLSGSSTAERVAALAVLLNEQGYMSKCECASDGTILLTEHNCPIDFVARIYPQACASELQLYEEVLGVSLEQEATIATGSSSCRYRVLVSDRTS